MKENKIGIYLASYKALHPNYNIIYQDINGKRDLSGDMLNIDLTPYDYIIATPPCNYYSRCNYRRETSKYSQETKHLLPEIIEKLCKLEKPFIVENVRNSVLFNKLGLYDKPCFIYIIGRHTYWTNIIMTTDIEQKQDLVQHGIYIGNKDKKDDAENTREGGWNVKQVIELFMESVEQL